MKTPRLKSMTAYDKDGPRSKNGNHRLYTRCNSDKCKSRTIFTRFPISNESEKKIFTDV